MSHKDMSIRADMNIIDRNNLVAVGDVFLDEMFVIHQVKVVEKADKDGNMTWFVSLPGKKKGDGWEKIVKIKDPDLRTRINDAVIDETKRARQKDLGGQNLAAEIRLYDKGDTKAYATVIFNDAVQIENVRICEKDGKLTVYYPFEKNGEYYQNLAGPATMYMKHCAERVVLEAYDRKARLQESIDKLEQHEAQEARAFAERGKTP